MGTLRWSLGAWLALIALQALTSPSAPTRIATALSGARQLVERVLDPTVPAIPDLRTKTTTLED